MTSDTPTTRDYRDTVFLPKTDFPQRAGLPKREPEWIRRWDEMSLYQKLREDAAGRPKWLLHDGPPYANGHIHLGTAMNKILKDICVRSHQMTGFDASYLPGWDCHGLPIEWKVEEEFRSKGRTKDDVAPAEFRARCREYAAEWVDVQKAEFRALGVEGEWDDPYLTMEFGSEAAIVGEFLDVAMSGRLVRGAKPVMWSPVERTALAEAEVEYHDRKVPVIWVKFPVIAIRTETRHEVPGGVRLHSQSLMAWRKASDLWGASIVIWTTTPWTIPANQAISFSPDVEYGLYEVKLVMSEEDLGFPPYAKQGDRIVIAQDLADATMAAAKVTDFELLRLVDPREIAYCKHPLATPGWAEDEASCEWEKGFFDSLIDVIPGEHVTADAGTGFVHTAPAHGEDDFEVWKDTEIHRRENRAALESASQEFQRIRESDDAIREIVDADGCYTSDLPERLRGLDIIRTSGKKRGQPGKANDEVIKALAESGNLLARGVTTIRDAHSWRSKAPVIRRATPQWFIAMDQKGTDGSPPLRELVMNALQDVEFFPKQGRNRLEAMVKDRPDWLVSRQRNWGVPLTIFVNSEGQSHTAALPAKQAEAVNTRIKAAVAEGGVEAWFSTDPAHFFEGTGASPEGWEKVTDVLDVWFDSGTTHAFALRKRGIIDEKTGRADLYLEGSDQHRGWFQSSLLECCATRGMAPYREVLTHGFIVDSEGKKMSKSIGNTVEPQEVQKQYGIEILRIWAASADFTEDLRISEEILKGTAESYRRLRNTLRYLLGALEGYTEAEAVAPADMPGLERWVLHRLAELDVLVRSAYDQYDFKRAMAALVNFCAVDLSAVYFDIRKDSLYCDPVSATADHWDDETAAYGNRRRAARTVMHAVLERLVTWLAPIMPFTTEEAFLESVLSGRAASVHLLQLPKTPADWRDEALAERWERIFRVRKVVTGALEVQRREKTIGSSLEAAPEVHITDSALLAAFEGEDAADIFITSGAVLTQTDAPGGSFTLDDVEGVAVVFERAEGVKCARSWKYFDPATALDGFPDITPRDALAVRALDAEA
ncbi:MAG: isoleucine--tRNA ligase [Hyphomonadaceae bacterium]|nr:isoleucine--tRNA ligase [Hyphomonadaceae bacterium]